MTHKHTRVFRWKFELPRRNRSKRAKSFKTEEAANKWAESRGVKEYTVKNLRPVGAKDNKFIVVEKK